MSKNNKQDEHQSKFDFSKHFTNAILNPDDLKFFYYDIGKDNMDGAPFLYDWDAVVNEFSDVLDIDSCSKEQIDKEFVQNKIRFTISAKEKEPKAAAFFRHLRNAFAHYHIERDGENYCLIDKDPQDAQITMRGLVKAEILKKFCFRFFEQRDEMINRSNDQSKTL